MAASQSRTVHSKTHMVSPIHTRNIGPTGPLYSTRPPWIRPLTKGSSDMPWKIERATVPGKCPIASTIPSPWIQPLPKGRSDMPWMIQRANVAGKWLCPNHVRYIPRPTWSVLSTQEILDPSVQYQVLYHHLESSLYVRAGLICHEILKELLHKKNGCVPITNGTFQDPQSLSYPHKKYWIHRSNIQYYTIDFNPTLA